MTIDEFNALPLEARRYIESQNTCLSCGKKKDLDFHYKNYLKMKQENLYTLRRGAVASKNQKGEVSILYPLDLKDSKEIQKEKLSLALKINKVKPDAFSQINEEAIKEILKPAKKVENIEEQKAE